jgi:exodeoxyribonuclease V gamma subunit
MLYVIRSNRVERLVERLAHDLSAAPLSDPFARELVVVHSQGMQRWLSQRLSQRLGAPAGANGGICANVEYPFPAGLVRRVLDGCLGESADVGEQIDPWEPDRLVWSVLELLDGLLAEPGFERPRDYLEKDKRSFGVESIGRRRFSFARRLADLFDRYSIYRPLMTRAWGAGDPAGPSRTVPLPSAFAWQAKLYKRLQDHVEDFTLADRFERARQVLADRTQRVGDLPERVNFFGLNALPPSYLGVLQALANVHDVYVYLLCPSREYWAEVRNRREILQQTRVPHEIDQALAVGGNPILASFGRLARDFQLHLESHQGPDYVETGEQPFEDPMVVERPPTMLEVLQSDILHFRTRGPKSTAEPIEPASDDRSIQVHACHGTTRQVEVLRDAILRLMEDPTSDLEPRDIVVMMPDVEAYAPVVSAVFAEGRVSALDSSPSKERWGDGGAPQLPFAIADRNLREINPVAAALMQILEMVHGRVEASSVLDLLRNDVVRRRFDIDADDLPQIEQWVRESGIRWGIDGDHRKKHAQPEDHENTWRFGLDRLLLGVAMPDEHQRQFGGAVPFDDMEGGAVDRLGRFVEFCEVLFAQLRYLDHPRPLAAWDEALGSTLDRLVATSDSGTWLVQQVREVLAGVLDRSRDKDGKPFETPLELDAIRTALGGGFQIGRGTIGHQTGSITFCAMVPMRSIPHKVVCLLGMDDGAFPRADPSPALDLIALHRQVGDRSPREEDRFLFLEAILAARKNLIITYTGHDIRTNEGLPPAVPVGQLLDVLDDSFDLGDESARQHVTAHHPLQAFSPHNFLPDDPLSYDRRMLDGARRLSEEDREERPFLVGELAEDEDDEPSELLELDELIRFWNAPVASIISRRLGISLREDKALVEDREPVELDNLERWGVGQDLLLHELARRQGEWEQGALGRGGLPPGAPGRCIIEDAARRVERIMGQSAEIRSGAASAINIDLDLGGRRLVGAVKPVHGERLVHLQFGTIHPKHRLAQWIRFLALNAQHPEVDWVASAYGKDDKPRTLAALPADTRQAQAKLALARLITRYLEGQTRMLKFFNKASYAYARAIQRGKHPNSAWFSAAGQWHKEWEEIPGEDADPYNIQAFGSEAPWRDVHDREFEALATEVWDPVFATEGK